MNQRSIFKVVLAIVLASTLHGPMVSADPSAIKTVEVLSPVYTVDAVYRSMLGPQSQQSITLMEADPPELLWITGYKTVMVGPDGKTPRSEEFMCHSNLDFDADAHRKIFGMTQPISSRLFTLSQGQLDIQFPDGFGIPVLSSEKLNLATQILNLNEQESIFDVRHRVTIEFIRDKDATQPMKALYMRAANGLKLLEGDNKHYKVNNADEGKHGPGCSLGEQAGHREWEDGSGSKFTGHWVVKPGKEVNHTNNTGYMDLRYDTTAHYIAVHVHPFAKTLELKDLTADKTVFKSKIKNSKGRIGIDRVEYFSSEEGIPLYKDHQYDLISVYDNTSGKDQDSMAVMFMYVLDKEFKKPKLEAAAEIPPAGVIAG